MNEGKPWSRGLQDIREKRFCCRNVGFGGRFAPIIRAWAFGSNEEWFLPRQGKLPAISV